MTTWRTITVGVVLVEDDDGELLVQSSSIVGMTYGNIALVVRDSKVTKATAEKVYVAK